LWLRELNIGAFYDLEAFLDTERRCYSHPTVPDFSLQWLRRILLILFFLGTILLPLACNKGQGSQPVATAAKREPTLLPTPPSSSKGLSLPVNFERRTGDLDDMVRRRNIRVLVIPTPIGFFYNKGIPRGAVYETVEELQKFVNKKLKSGTMGVKITYLPVAPSQLEAALTQGMGDLITNGIVITPEREQRVSFSNPIQTGLTQIVVCGSNFGPFSSLEELSGKEIYVNPLMTSFDNLQKANASLQRQGEPLIQIRSADKNLTDDDLIQMVNAGLIPATVTTRERADLWSKVFVNLRVHPEVVLASGEDLAWAMRKNNPQLKQLVDEFISTHGAGTSFGNTLVRRYLIKTNWVKNSTSESEMKKFRVTIGLFQKYATQYDFDYLMIAAQGYQESMLNQERRSPRGAVGIMQVLPKYAAASPINIPDVGNADGNIHAGVKMLRNIADTYFEDDNLDPTNRTLFVFASYNAGPTRVAGLRKKASALGLDPNIWFANVEVVAAKDIGQETVTYVGNIYKYYVSYKLALEEKALKQKAKEVTAN
jgi:membrane-bound lytic murein transglycosylase MltF